MESYREIVQLLIERGADANHANKDGDTALIQVASNGRTEIVNALIAQKTPPLNSIGIIIIIL